MTTSQLGLVLLFVLLFGLFLWGRFRHDVVAFGGLMLAVVAGIVPAEHAFDGLAHTATVSVAAMLVLTRAITLSGATDQLGAFVDRFTRSTVLHVASLSGVTAAMSTVMNNVGALGLTMPVAMQTAARAERSPSLLLMPMSFAALLGGLVTLVGTPPNIIAASYRANVSGEPFHMFDYSFVGLPLALAGVAFVSILGWRFLPSARRRAARSEAFFDIGDYVTEVRLSASSPLDGRTVAEVGELFAAVDVAILGLVRLGRRVPNVPRRFVMRPDDVLIVEVAPDNLMRLLESYDLVIEGHEGSAMGLLSNEDVRVGEYVVVQGSELDGRSGTRAQLAGQFNVNLMAIARRGARVRDRLDRVVLRPSDVLLLQGEEERLGEVVRLLGLLPLAARPLAVERKHGALATLAIFAGGLALSAFGILPLEIALGVAIVVLVVADLLPARQLYEAIDWPVILLLASMIPIGDALQTTGLTALIAGVLGDLSSDHGPVAALILLFVCTALLTDVINNAATVVVMAPIAIAVAQAQGVNVDTYVMGVSIAASCAFLTPIGHQNNTLVMGPGGYAFGDYWRMGLPLQAMLTTLAIPLLLFFWPLR
ncbi:MAG: SLC13 family permease [Geminicoccaceae bacterium]|nr:SLC13 family permease [Geminicoccaceae bacterium]